MPGTPRSARVVGFLVAEALSAIGSWATLVAVWGYAAYEYNASAADVSLFGVAFTLPGILLGPVSGAVVDRAGPKATLAMAKVIGIAASLLLLVADDFRSLALLSFLHGVSSTFAHPAIQSMPPRLVGAEHLARTNALVSLTDELAIVLGPVAAGVSIAAFGFRGAFVFDAATYLLGLLVLPLVRLRPVADALPLEPGAEQPPVRLRDALEGWRLIVAAPVLRRTVACTATVHLLYGTAVLAEPLYVRDVLERTEETFASLQTAFGVFLVLGGLAVARLGERLATFGWVAAGVALSGGTALLYLATPWVAVAFLGVGLWGLATSVISGPSRTVLQRSSPERAHGRVLSADFVAANVAMLAGVGASGVLIDAVGVPWTIASLGLLVAAVAASLFAADRRDQLRGRRAPARSMASTSMAGTAGENR